MNPIFPETKDVKTLTGIITNIIISTAVIIVALLSVIVLLEEGDTKRVLLVILCGFAIIFFLLILIMVWIIVTGKGQEVFYGKELKIRKVLKARQKEFKKEKILYLKKITELSKSMQLSIKSSKLTNKEKSEIWKIISKSNFLNQQVLNLTVSNYIGRLSILISWIKFLNQFKYFDNKEDPHLIKKINSYEKNIMKEIKIEVLNNVKETDISSKKVLLDYPEGKSKFEDNKRYSNFMINQLNKSLNLYKSQETKQKKSK